MATLNDYLAQTQRFLREAKQDLLDPADLINYINRARREVAGRTQCVRRLTPISGQVVRANVVNGGSGYSSQTVVTITPPDFPSGKLPYPSGNQATAQPIIVGGVIVAVDIKYGGDGYFQPQATVSDAGGGTGAEVTLSLSPINTVQPNQEQYPLANIDVSTWPGVQSVYSVHIVSIIYANYRYNLPKYSFPVYQGLIRQYPFQYTYVPTFCSQVDRGDAAILFMYPWPSQEYQAEFYCACLPQDLVTNLSVDVIPQPWADVVPYFAASLAYGELQNLNASKFYLDLFDNMLLRKSNYESPGRATNIYGRW